MRRKEKLSNSNTKERSSSCNVLFSNRCKGQNAGNIFFPLALSMNQRRLLLQEGGAAAEFSSLQSNQRGRRSRLASGRLHGRIPHESPTHMRVAFFLVMPNSLLPSSPESRNISKSSRPQTKSTSTTMAAAYDRSPAFVLSRVAGSRTPAPDGSRGSRGKARGGKRGCRHA